MNIALDKVVSLGLVSWDMSKVRRNFFVMTFYVRTFFVAYYNLVIKLILEP